MRKRRVNAKSRVKQPSKARETSAVDNQMGDGHAYIRKEKESDRVDTELGARRETVPCGSAQEGHCQMNE